MSRNEPSPVGLHSQGRSVPPDWRWRLSGLPDDSVVVGPAAADEWVVRTRAWRRAASTRSTTCSVAGGDHAFLEAFRLYSGSATIEREMLEAALLTRESRDRVANVVGVPAAVVEVYSNVFFDVAERLDDRDWVETAVIGSDRSARHAVWKRFAYNDGLASLEMVVAVSLGRPLPRGALDRVSPSASVVESWLRAAYANIITIAAASPENAPQLQQQFREWVAENPRPKSRSMEDILWEATKAAALTRSPRFKRACTARLPRAVRTVCRDPKLPKDPRHMIFRVPKENAE